jgi:hypothetical protein
MPPPAPYQQGYQPQPPAPPRSSDAPRWHHDDEPLATYPELPQQQQLEQQSNE